MKAKGKTGIIILVILLILSLTGAIIGFYSFQKERLKVIVLNEELENLKVEKRIAEAKLVESRKRVIELDTQLQATRTEIEELNSELEQTKNQKDEFYSQIEKLQFQLQGQEKLKNQLEAKQIQALDQIDKLQILVQELQAGKDELEAGLNKFRTEGEVALGKIVVEQKEIALDISSEEALSGIPSEVPSMESIQAQDIPTLEGEVLVINKDYDFAVTDLGSQNGIGVGDILLVYHNDNYIGDIQVDRIQETMSVCLFVSEAVEDKIGEGDKVIRK